MGTEPAWHCAHERETPIEGGAEVDINERTSNEIESGPTVLGWSDATEPTTWRYLNKADAGVEGTCQLE
jgi:hypothetical protein